MTALGTDLPLAAADLLAIERVQATTDWMLLHVRQVARLSMLLFDELHAYHALGPGEARLLAAAALLHDVGYPVDPPKHHKVSARIIRSQLGPPWRLDDVTLVALIARYHRKALPKAKHGRYQALDSDQQRSVGWLAAILRVADGLDRGHDGAVRALRASRVDGRLEIRVSGAPNLAADIAGAIRKRDLLERTLGLPVAVRA